MSALLMVAAPDMATLLSRASRKLELRPWTVKAALPFVARVHRRLPKVQGAMWAVRVVNGLGETVGVAVITVIIGLIVNKRQSGFVPNESHYNNLS